ncbi:hypothetical protein LAZ67_22000099 [Cordylochernes scorpioides]|uniref:Uncharacterized protein n=1 Tax=Cordylochernes scorpioides TaxID=51811 RepID=A0ABY6LSX3_9ARAC|nr:hypothetical protein LAZ67_22000099 [Cordylochernes scorpioides]
MEQLLPYGSCDPQLATIVDVDLTCFCQGFHRSLGTLSLVPLRPFSCGVKSGCVVVSSIGTSSSSREVLALARGGILEPVSENADHSTHGFKVFSAVFKFVFPKLPSISTKMPRGKLGKTKTSGGNKIYFREGPTKKGVVFCILENYFYFFLKKHAFSLPCPANMPRRSRPLIGRNTAASRRYRNARAIETPLQSETRRALRRLRYSEARVAATQTMQVPVQRIQLWTHKPFSGLQYNAHIDYKADSSVDIGQMSRVCQFCSALRFRDEPFGLCCKQDRGGSSIGWKARANHCSISYTEIFKKSLDRTTFVRQLKTVNKAIYFNFKLAYSRPGFTIDEPGSHIFLHRSK